MCLSFPVVYPSFFCTQNEAKKSAKRRVCCFFVSKKEQKHKTRGEAPQRSGVPPGGSLASRNTKTARFEGSVASIKIPFFQDKKPQFLRHGNLATPPEFRVNLGLIRCTDQGAVHTCPYSTSNRPSRSLHSTERRRRCLDFSPSAHHTRCPPWWSLCMVIEPY